MLGDISSVRLPLFGPVIAESLADLVLCSARTDNAGMVLGTDHVGQIAEEDVQQMFETNVLGLISLTQAFVNSKSGFGAGDWRAEEIAG